jgi:hypothetical protein
MSGAGRVDAQAVKQAELDLILGNKKDGHDPQLWGLALSGGGIRSATFALGVLRALAGMDLLRGFHYQSTISGGGYTGAFLQGLIHRSGYDEAFNILKTSVRDVAAPEGDRPAHGNDADSAKESKQAYFDTLQPLLHLREYSNYLSPRKAAFSGDTLGMLGTYVRNVVLIQISLCALFLAICLLPLWLYSWLWELDQTRSNMFMLLAAIMGICAALLLGWVTTRTRRAEQDNGAGESSRAPYKVAPPSGAVRFASMALIWLLTASVLTAAVGLWGINQKCYVGPLVSRFVPDLNADSATSNNDVLQKTDATHQNGQPLTKAADKQQKASGSLNPPPGCERIGQSVTRIPLTRDDRMLFLYGFGLYAGFWTLWLIFDGLFDRRPPSDTNLSKEWHYARMLVTIGVAGIFLASSLVWLRHIFGAWNQDIFLGLWRALIFGPSVVLIAVELTGIIHLGLAGAELSDLQREVWARVGGKTAALTVVGFGVSLAMIMYGAWFYRCDFNGDITRWMGGLAWMVSTGSGVIAAYMQRSSDTGRVSRLTDIVVRVAPWIFLLGLLMAISAAVQISVPLLKIHKNDAAHFLLHNADHYLIFVGFHLQRAGGYSPEKIFAAMVLAVLLWIFFGYFIDLNKFSMNSFYRNRLVRCYLGASNKRRAPEPTTNFDPKDDIVHLDKLAKPRVRNDGDPRPLYPLIGTTLNLLAVKQLDWQYRRGASFCLTPGYCGYIPPPSHYSATPVGDICARIAGTSNGNAFGPSVATRVTLGDAMAISGAAISPNMGYHSSPAATFLLTLFDARLGWWLPHPGLRRASDFKTTFYGTWLIREMLGMTSEKGKFIYLSDGGHFENLGIYELVRRECRFILCVDASADPQREFEDLGNAIQKCRTDFGVEITIDVSGLRCNESGQSSRSCAVGKIDYPGKTYGTLLYLKPTLTGTEPNDIGYYAKAHPSFPHEPTYNQFFDEPQFESYRRLGEYIAYSSMGQALERAADHVNNGQAQTPAAVPGPDIGENTKAAIDVQDSELKEQFIQELKNRWLYTRLSPSGHSSANLAAMAKLFGELRRSKALSVLDAQMYPAWSALSKHVHPAPAASSSSDDAELASRFPENKNFRTCFYFCQELAQLMESVFHELDLDQFWQHPDNYGWMNAFRQWSWSPMFRIAWVSGSPNFGRRYTAFCEQRLGLPRLSDVVYIEKSPFAGDSGWRDYCDDLYRRCVINEMEQSGLKSQPIVDQSGKPLSLFVLHLKWSKVLRKEGVEDRTTTVGVAVLRGKDIVMFRIQNHLRRVGLAGRFMRLLVEKQSVESVNIASGDYGMLGTYTEDRAKQASDRLYQLLQATKSHLGKQANGESGSKQTPKPS